MRPAWSAGDLDAPATPVSWHTKQAVRPAWSAGSAGIAGVIVGGGVVGAGAVGAGVVGAGAVGAGFGAQETTSSALTSSTTTRNQRYFFIASFDLLTVLYSIADMLYCVKKGDPEYPEPPFLPRIFLASLSFSSLYLHYFRAAMLASSTVLTKAGLWMPLLASYFIVR